MKKRHKKDFTNVFMCLILFIPERERDATTYESSLCFQRVASLPLSGKEKPMTRDNGTWSYRWNGVTISAPTLEKLIKAVAELGLLEGGEEWKC